MGLKMTEKLKPQTHICPICNKKSELYAVYDIIHSAPCLNCQLIKLGYKKNENNKSNKSI